MSKLDAFWLVIAGTLTWVAATVFYVTFARNVIEHAFWFYALNALLIGAALTIFYELTIRLRQVFRAARPWAGVFYALPGLAGAAVVTARFQSLFPDLPPESLGRYAALILVGYALMLNSALERPARRTPVGKLADRH